MSKDPHAKRFEIQRLVERSLDLARHALLQQGSFLPGFIAVQPSGKYDIGVAAQGGNEGWNLLITALRQKASAKQIRAAAVYRDVKVRARGATEDIDAVQVVAELASGEACNVFQIYRLGDETLVFEEGREVELVPSVIFAESDRSTPGTRRWWEFWK
ncbi:hypothetical protein SOCEGT47_026460 [Sorangium cellulosum]|uniref:Uncharacterized protein n=1 Tax=Sorangium cellulosum TaxID=56 RepID=A0A4P2PZ05_SORCE|nr:hypothetical protein [Sorangium cellulosum]AUX22145.1 hypothetical protein SOCEGT47_026460 [Sorangium cellulosum]